MIYHYTIQEKVDEILAAQLLRTTDLFICQGEKPVVWCTKSSEWEPTANKRIEATVGDELVSVALNATETHQLAGLARIALPTNAAPHSWKEWRNTSGVKAKVAAKLYAIGHRNGSNPNDWVVSYESIPASVFLSVQFWNGDAWTEDRPAINEPDEDTLQVIVQTALVEGRYKLVD